MKFWQRINKNTFRGMAAALVVAAAVMGGTPHCGKAAQKGVRRSEEAANNSINFPYPYCFPTFTTCTSPRSDGKSPGTNSAYPLKCPIPAPWLLRSSHNNSIRWFLITGGVTRSRILPPLLCLPYKTGGTENDYIRSILHCYYHS